MARKRINEIRKALYPLGTTLIKYNEKHDSYTLMRLFFKALGHMKASALKKKIENLYPHAKIIKIWIQPNGKDRMSGYECIELKI